MNRGSEWNRWDLHIHTPGTKLNDNFKDEDGNNIDQTMDDRIWKEYCSILNNSGIKCFGITDYFSVEGYLYLKENRDEFGLNKDIVLFPNIELRVSGLVPKGERKSPHKQVNVHVIFSEDVTKNELESFLMHLHTEDKDGRKKNFRDDINELIENDYFLYVPHYKDIDTALKDSLGANYKNETLIMIPNGDDGLSTKKGTSHGENRDFMKNSVDIVQTTDHKSVTHYLNNAKDFYGRSIPCVSGSDAHDFNGFLNYDKQKNTWIKADTTFEGLKSILYEPKYRVKIQKTNPATKVNSKIISHIKLSKKDFGKRTLHFNEDMNVIIGGRSSGKSLLLSIIGKKATDLEKLKNDNGSYDELINEKIKDSELYYKDGSIINGDMIIEFFYQDRLQQIARDRVSRNTFIDRTLQDIETMDIIDTKIETRKSELDAQVEELLEQKNIKYKLQQENHDLQTEEKIKNNIKEITNKIQEISYSFTEEEKKIIEEKNSKLIEIKKREKELNKKIEKIELIDDKNIITVNNNFSDEIINLLKEEFTKLEDDIKSVNDKYRNEIHSLQTELLKEKNSFSKQVTKIKSDETMIKYLESIEKTPELKKLTDALKNEQDNLGKRNEYNQSIEAIDHSINMSSEEIIKLIEWEKYNYSDEILSEEKLTIRYETNIDKRTLVGILKNNLSTRKTKYKEIAKDGFKEIINYGDEPISPLTSQSFKKTLKAIILEDENDIFKRNKSLGALLKELAELSYVEKNYKITYEDADFETMSEGKKALVLLLIKLEIGEEDCPILIDQPEDNLDNRSIVNDIVSYFKEEKLKRQLFIVTHNANIVIGGDSENVIIANEHDETNSNPDDIKYYYKNGSLEEKSIKDEVCEILEGGLEAFRTRENRYSFE